MSDYAKHCETFPELQSEIHKQFRAAHEGHKPHEAIDASRSSTGVIWV